jgi:2-iminobutanoate/2-iminopropanoate deaminase
VKKAVPAHPEVPISKAMRAGDFVFTSAYGPWTFDPAKVTFEADGSILDDGTGNAAMPFAEQVHRTFGFISAALASLDCGLEDVVSCECWLSEARDFVAFNEIYKTYFVSDPPVRSVFPALFMFGCKIEMKVIAWKPVASNRFASSSNSLAGSSNPLAGSRNPLAG